MREVAAISVSSFFTSTDTYFPVSDSATTTSIPEVVRNYYADRLQTLTVGSCCHQYTHSLPFPDAAIEAARSEHPANRVEVCACCTEIAEDADYAVIFLCDNQLFSGAIAAGPRLALRIGFVLRRGYRLALRIAFVLRVALIINLNSSDLRFRSSLGPFRWHGFSLEELSTLNLPDVTRLKRLVVPPKRELGHPNGIEAVFSDDVTAGILEIDRDLNALERLAPLVFKLERYAGNFPVKKVG